MYPIGVPRGKSSDASPALLEELSEHYAGVLARCTRLYPDARPCLESLSSRFSLALLTNSPGRTARARLRYLGLEPLFTFVGVGEELGAFKPCAEAFTDVLEATDVPAPRGIIIGDNFEEDILGARRVGLPGVWLRRPTCDFPDGEADQAYAVVNSLDEFRLLMGGR